MELAVAPAPQTPPLEPPPQPKTERKNIPLIFGTFLLSGDEFAIEMTELQEIAPPPVKIQKMPLAPEFLRGLFNLRGRILPVIDLRAVLQLPPAIPNEDHIPCMAILRQGPACVGVLFDAIGEILRLRHRDIVPLQNQNPSADARQTPVKSILTQNGGERVIQILDLNSILAIRNLPSLERRSPERLAEKSYVNQRMKEMRREKLIGFTIGDFNLAFEMKCVRAILDRTELKPSPRKSSLCESVVTFEKRMVPVVSLAQVLQLDPDAELKRIVVCQLEDTRVAFEVGEVSSIMPFSREKVLPIPVLDEFRPTFVRGCFTHTDGTEHIVLNEQGTLTTPELLDISFGHRQLSNETEVAEAAAALIPRISIITFRMGKLFALKLLDVVEVLTAPRDLIRTPGMPPAVLGVVNLRGTPISVLDPRKLLDLDPAPSDANPSLLVFHHEGKKVAMRVDSVESIVSIPAGSDMELPDIFFQADQPKLLDSFKRGLHLEHNGVKSVVLMLGADQIVKLLVEALSA
jgi:purine-binding chemotaxis protein CheW